MKEEFKANKHQEDAVQAAATIDAVLRVQSNWKELWFYQKTVVLYQMTYVFCQRFLPKYGDRTVDQMVQAARSGKQNRKTEYCGRLGRRCHLYGDGTQTAERGPLVVKGVVGGL